MKLLFSRMGVEIPAGFVTNRLATVEDDIADEPMRESTKRVLETLILVMAVEKYEYDPSADDQGHVFQAICDAAKANGLSLAEKPSRTSSMQRGDASSRAKISTASCRKSKSGTTRRLFGD
ncbi:hypothetical protein EJ078_10805 [Mesorhizobium sp. M1A.F.Ca.IN.022.06.1.1]|uniref:hypothetical protein n=1 Tax=Mesorhizobium sp. M1A.F.Ca.IN.022.06.1.1 TaxID=2493680 RepID=UPI000F75DA7B|nr:hypothetical protein [Mesorhizobium sp. M1A.F.Ca.IN.022.06.1.1]AZO59669.1 hypothetical protein EJ078_10805 [Mesorhizobium sp. M1A.F.Ca.IN.022.06.1.1]